MKIVLTHHAKDSLRIRFCCNPDKYLKVTTKAWNSKERVFDGDIANKRKYQTEIYPETDSVYRKFMGKIFVFDATDFLRFDRVVLITIYPSARGLASKRPKKIYPH